MAVPYSETKWAKEKEKAGTGTISVGGQARLNQQQFSPQAQPQVPEPQDRPKRRGFFRRAFDWMESEEGQRETQAVHNAMWNQAIYDALTGERRHG